MERFLKITRKLNDKKIALFFGVIVFISIMIPIVQVFFSSLVEESEFIIVLRENGFLIQGIINTIELILKVGLMASIIGFLSAFFMVFFHIKFARVVNILLMIPLGIPVYVAAYTYTNIYYEFPFLETLFRSSFFMNGTVYIYSLFLYPYVYIASKSYLKRNLNDFIEASFTLKHSFIRTFFKTILPLSRPIIIGSVLFVIFEALSDFAVVEYYGQLTLSRYINIAWFNQGDIGTASKFAVYILLIMGLLIFTERYSRKKKNYTSTNISHKSFTKQYTSTTSLILIHIFIYLVIILGVILPIRQMVLSSIRNISYVSRLEFMVLIYNTLKITTLSIFAITITALLMTTIIYYLKGVKKTLLSSVSVMGYSIPSMVLALGVYVFFVKIDINLYKLGFSGMIFTSTVLLIVLGFFFKFFSVAFSNLSSAYAKIDRNIMAASETLGESKFNTMVRVSIPMLNKSIISVIIILFIDMMKELTLVYSLRPFNFKTLSTEVYRYAGNEMVEVAALPSLVIILLCSLLIIYLEEGLKNVKIRKY